MFDYSYLITYNIKGEKRMKKLVFFLRHNNDVDHISPVIYKWIQTKKIAADIIITSNKEFIKDYRIRYLKKISKGRSDINFYHITDILPSKLKWNYNLCQFYSKHQHLKTFTRSDSVIEKIVYYLINKHFKDVSLFCFDWTDDYFTRTLCAFAKSLNIPTVALPHGDEPFWNLIQREEDISYAQTLQPYIKRQFFDYIVVPNQLCANHYKFMEQDKIKVLGSPRFCDEWLEIHNQIKPKDNTLLTHPKFLKVVLFLRNKHWNINWQEVAINIKLITQYDEIFLIVRNHPRGTMTYDLLNNHPWMRSQKNLLVDDKINSSVLMDWSDIILDLGTSACWESIKNNKPTLMLEHLHANVTTIAHYMKKTIIRSRDELLDALRKFHKNKKRKWCKEIRRQKFIKEIIDCPDKQVLERYCNFLESLLNDKSETKIEE